MFPIVERELEQLIGKNWSDQPDDKLGLAAWLMPCRCDVREAVAVLKVVVDTTG